MQIDERVVTHAEPTREWPQMFGELWRTVRDVFVDKRRVARRASPPRAAPPPTLSPPSPPSLQYLPAEQCPPESLERSRMAWGGVWHGLASCS